MSRFQCSRCSTETGLLLESISLHSLADYYRCRTCGHVWVVDRDDESKRRDIVNWKRPAEKDVSDGKSDQRG
jgi:DNA-directed RNA polymerase subunit RPC12/RpoP